MSTAEIPEGGQLVEIQVSEVGAGPGVRSKPIDLDHVARLRLAVDSLPPVKVRRDGERWVLVDGEHRLEVHRQEKRATISCEVVVADEPHAIAIATKANTGHGLYLGMAERKKSVRRLIELTDWSNAVLADECGVSDKTVAEVRKGTQPRSTPKLGGAKTAGADGRRRPGSKADQVAQRNAIAVLLTEDPNASIASVAVAIGCTTMTVASVRDELRRLSSEAGHAPGSEEKAPADLEPSLAGRPQGRPALGLAPPPAAGPSVGEIVTAYPKPGDWKKAPGMTATNGARDFAQVFDRRLPHDNEAVDLVSPGCPAPLRAGAAAAAREAIAWWTAMEAALSEPTHVEAVQ